MKESTAIKAVATGTLEKCRDSHSPQLLVSEVTSEAPIKVAQSLTLPTPRVKPIISLYSIHVVTLDTLDPSAQTGSGLVHLCG